MGGDGVNPTCLVSIIFIIRYIVKVYAADNGRVIRMKDSNQDYKIVDVITIYLECVSQFIRKYSGRKVGATHNIYIHSNFLLTETFDSFSYEKWFVKYQKSLTSSYSMTLRWQLRRPISIW